MTLTAGTRLGPYEVIAPLGAGGMGEVWKARDTRLDRWVAIKVLPAEYAQDTQLTLRLAREAKTISQLNHPNICTLHDIGNENGTPFLVMELVEGESLADQIDRGPLPIREVLRYGAQMADALDRAHRAGIVHRDLKPGNVMITKSGVKLLDFGLAKFAAKGPATPDEPTVVHSRPLTAEGTVVGTMQYMAPEQLSGEAVDHRTDIFALGAVLYEMATGKRAFSGANKTSLIAAILSAEPRPISDMRPLSPPAFEHIVSKCLAKDPDHRWQSAYDIAEELRWIGQQSSGTMAAAGEAKRLRTGALLPWILATIAIAVAGFAAWRLRQAPPRLVTKTVVSNDVESAWNVAPAISPDGRRVAYPAGDSLWIRDFDELEPRKVPISGNHQPVLFWSPDSKWVAFVSDEKLWKIAPGGSAPVLIAALPRGSRFFHSGAWGADDRIVLAQYKGGLYEISARGGSLTESVPADPALVDFHHLLFLPDGKTLLAVPHKLDNIESIEVIRGKKRETAVRFDQGVVRGIAYSRTGHLLVSVGGANGGVWAVPFSAEKVAATGKQFLVAAGGGACSASNDGSLVYVANMDYAPKQIVHVDRSGKILAKISDVIDGAISPLLSPDGKTLAVAARNEDNYLSIEFLDLSTGARRRMTEGFAEDYPRAWSRDGRELLAFRSPTLNWTDPRFGLWSIPVNRSGMAQKIVTGWDANFTPDAQNIVFLTFTVRDQSNIATMPFNGGAATEIVKSSFPKTDVALSPDGHFLAYTTRESGTDEIFVTPYPSASGRWQVASGNASNPAWSADGHTIYFTADNRLLAASFAASPDVTIGQPVALFDATPLHINLRGSRYDIAHDGTIIAIQGLPPTKRQVVLVQNWFEEFK